MKVKYIVYIMGGINITVYMISNTHLSLPGDYLSCFNVQHL
jgi:hypothetical protein